MIKGKLTQIQLKQNEDNEKYANNCAKQVNS